MAKNRDWNGKLLLAFFASCLGYVLNGSILGFSAIFIPQLEDDGVRVDQTTKSLIASSSTLGLLVSTPISGFLTGRFGRRWTFLVQSVVMTIGWSVIGLSGGDVNIALVGRILCGIGFSMTPLGVYLIEIATTNVRGVFGFSGGLAIGLGLVAMSCLGAAVHWTWICLLNACSMALAVGIFAFLPESPAWLLTQGRKDEARKALVWLRSKEDVQDELDGLQKNKNDAKKNSLVGMLREFKHPSVFKPTAFLIGITLINPFAVCYPIIFFSVHVFQDLGFTANPHIPAIITISIRVLGSVVGLFFIRAFGRRTIMIGTAVSSALFLGLLALHIRFPEVFGHLGIVGHVVEIAGVLFSFGAGLGVVPWLLIELVPSKVRGLVSGAQVFTGFLGVFITIQTFFLMKEEVGEAATYTLYAGMAILTAVLCAIFLPESKGKTPQELETLFK